MHTRAQALSVLAPAVPNASAGRHAKNGDPGEDADFGFSQPFSIGPADEGEFDFSRPFLVDIGRAAVIAEYLRESGYPRCTADVVTEELAKPERYRSNVGLFAADQLKRAGWRP
ncbi:MAG TPA: hypothetical protein VF940_05105 [Streptosporangiaceae bacterium]